MLGENLTASQKTDLFQNGKEIYGLKWVLVGVPWQHHLIGNSHGNRTALASVCCQV